MKIINLITNEINQNGYNFNLLTKNKIGFLYTAPVNIVPEDCLACDGYVLKIEDYKKLYAVIGTTFNTGDETEDEFRIPDYNITKRFLQPGENVGALIEAGLPTHTHTITMNRTDKSGNDTDCVWSYGENRNGAAKVTSSAPNNTVYGKSTTVQPPSQVVHICIRYK